MKKTLVLILIVVLGLVMTTGCKKNSHDLRGAWKITLDDGSWVKYSFYGDRTGGQVMPINSSDILGSYRVNDEMVSISLNYFDTYYEADVIELYSGTMNGEDAVSGTFSIQSDAFPTRTGLFEAQRTSLY